MKSDSIIEEFLNIKNHVDQRMWVHENNDKALTLLWYFTPQMKELLKEERGV